MSRVAIPKGFCQCGCGEQTITSTRTSTRDGWVKGEYREFVRGHAQRHADIEIEFWRRVDQSGDGCWEWQGRKDPNGYGRFDARAIQIGPIVASRFAYQLTHGPIPDDMAVCHKCDNPPCCNPDHLFLNTQAGNIADMDAKGRRRTGPVRGSDNPNALLTEEKVVRIHELYATGRYSQKQIGEMFEVTRGCIADVVGGRSWTHVERGH